MVGRAKPGAEDLRQRPEMASLKLLVLKFVRTYIETWGHSPSYGEIAAALDRNRWRVRDTVKRLAAEGLLLRKPGPRGLALPEKEEEALRQLRALGWTIYARPDLTSGSGADSTNRALLPPPTLTYDAKSGDDGEYGSWRGEKSKSGKTGQRD